METFNTILMLYGTRVGFMVEIVVVVAMILVILVQRTSSDGLSGLGGGGGGGLSGHSIFSSSTSKNLLTRTTAILATIFILNSLVLAKLTMLNSHAPSIVEQYQSKVPSHSAAPHSAAPISATPATPANQAIPGTQTQTPASAAAPTTPGDTTPVAPQPTPNTVPIAE